MARLSILNDPKSNTSYRCVLSTSLGHMRTIFDADKFRCEASNILGALVNLNYLVREDANKASEVRRYAGMTEERLEAMTQLLKGNFDGGWYGRSQPQ